MDIAKHPQGLPDEPPGENHVQASWATPGRRRRVPGLRREEVAQLAGVSTEYYTQIERGNVAAVSDEVLHAVARALRLTEDEAVHFFDLARAAAGTRTAPRARRGAAQKVPDGIQALMDGMVTSPAVVMNRNLDLLAAKRLGPSAVRPGVRQGGRSAEPR